MRKKLLAVCVLMALATISWAIGRKCGMEQVFP